MVLLPKLWWALLILLVTAGLVILTIFVDAIIPDQCAYVARLIVRFVVGIIALLPWPESLWVIVNWYNDTYEVDDREITHIEKLPFGLRQSTSGALLERIQNVSI